MQQLVKLVGADAHNGFFLVNQAFFNHFYGHTDSGGGGTFAVAALQHPQFAVFNGEFHILHVFVVFFEVVANVNQFLIKVRPFFFQGSAVAFRGHRLRRTDTGHNVFTLSIYQIFAVVNVFAGCRVAREAYAGSAVVAGIAEDHGLNVNGRTPVAGDVVEFAIGDRAGSHPGTEYGADAGPQLIPRILRNDFAQFLTDFLIFLNQFFQVFGGQVGVGLVTFSFLHRFESAFVFVQIGAENNVGEHLQETTVRVVGKSFGTGSFGQSLNRFVVQTEVQNGVHHARHGNAGAGTNREQQRVFGIGKFFAHDFFNAGNGGFNLVFQVGRIGFVVGIVVGADFSRNCKSGRNGQTDDVHFRQVGTLTAQEVSHGGIAFGLAVSKCIYPFTHGNS